MTNFELLMKGKTFKDKGLTIKEVGKILCAGIELTGLDCLECPYTQYCGIGVCGAEEFLKRKA